jgi:hypothetical protein
MTDVATIARASALQIEAKKHALRQQQDGCWILTMKVHSNDMPEAIMKAAMGQRYICALVAIGDDEQPLPSRSNDRSGSDAQPVPNKAPQPPARADGVEKEKPSKSWSGMPYSTQAALRCRDPIFRAFLREMCGAPANTPEQAEQFVKTRCGVSRKRDILPDTEAETYWLEIEQWFDVWKVKDRVMA